MTQQVQCVHCLQVRELMCGGDHVCLHERCCHGQSRVYVTPEVYHPSFINVMWIWTRAKMSNAEAQRIPADSSSVVKIV